MELLSNIVAGCALVLLANSIFGFFLKNPSETPVGAHSRKVRNFFYITISIGLIAASLVLG